MDKFKIILSVFLIFLITFLLSFFSLEFAKQKGKDDFFRHANPYDLVIKNARIIDGTGGGVVEAHIGISDGIIKTVSKNIRRGNANIFDATGYTLMPKMTKLPDEVPWVSRDLPGAMSRFPYYRIFFKASEDKLLAGRSLEAVLREGIYKEEDLLEKFSWIVLIAPDEEELETDTLNKALYKITGWRSDALGIEDLGKILPEYKMEGIFYRTSQIDRTEMLDSLNNEIQPLGQFTISGSVVLEAGKDVFKEKEKEKEEEEENQLP